MGIDYPERRYLANTPTPLQYAERLTKQLGGAERLFFKRDDFTGCGLSGNKIRKLEFLLAEAQSEKADVIITAGGVQSNHCRATAAACAKLGLKCHLLLRGESSYPYDGNLLLDRLFGAEIRFHPADEFRKNYQEILDDTLEFYEKRGMKTYYFPIGGSVATGAWGYIRAFDELCRQIDQLKERNRLLRDKVFYIVSAAGSGGTLAGLLLGKQILERDDIKILAINVCDDAAYFENQVRTIATEFKNKYFNSINLDTLAPEIVEGYVGEGYAIPYPEVIETIRMVARSEGILLDPVYTGKAFYGLRELMIKGKFPEDSYVIFIHTGGVFSLFAYRDKFI